MKSLKIVLASLLLVAGTIAVSSFTVKEFKSNAFAIKCFEYMITMNKNLNPGAGDFIQAIPFKTVTNWIQSTPVPPTSLQCPGGPLICQICFNEANLTDGVTFSELLEDLRAQILASGVSPTHGATINVNVTGAIGSAIVPVTIYKTTYD